MEILELKSQTRAYIPRINRISKTEAKKRIESEGVRVKKIFKIELAIYRLGTYVYFQRRE